MSRDSICAPALAALLALLVPASAFAARTPGDPAIGAAIAERVCVACHGPTGVSPIPNTPKLAGLHANYLVKQMRDYRDGKRTHEVMTGIVAGLTQEEFDHVAAHFAEQEPIPGVVTDHSLLPLGQSIYLNGDPGRGVPSCSGCHGDAGEGTRRFPRLAGQSIDYTLEQMRRFAAGERANDRGLMQTVSDRLTDDEIQAVAQYIASLNGLDAEEE